MQLQSGVTAIGNLTICVNREDGNTEVHEQSDLAVSVDTNHIQSGVTAIGNLTICVNREDGNTEVHEQSDLAVSVDTNHIQSGVTAIGNLTIYVNREDGNIEVHEKSNLVVSVGKNHIASRMVGTSSGVMSYMALGSNSTTPVIGDTTLGTELGRVALTSYVASGNVVTATATFPAGTATGALVEAGILNASSSGTMLCHTTFGTITKNSGDSITIVWNVTIS